jgi:hypothetical protein
MNKQWNMYKQLPRAAKKPLIGTLSIEPNGDATFFSKNDRVLAAMVKATIEWAAAGGILFSGMEQKGVDKFGRRKFVSQEWFLSYNIQG